MDQGIPGSQQLIFSMLGGFATLLWQWGQRKIRSRVTELEAIVLYRASAVGGMLSRDEFLPGPIILRFEKPGNAGALLPLSNIKGEVFSLLEKGHIVADHPPHTFRLTTLGWGKVAEIQHLFDAVNPSENPECMVNPSWVRRQIGW